MRAVQEATPAVWGVILQFPFYAGIAGIITGDASQRAARERRSSASRRRRRFRRSSRIYSAVLGVFVPSGGSKWVIEAPYVMQAAHELKVHLGWVVAGYDLGEALANLRAAVLDAADARAVRPARPRRDGLHVRRLPGAGAGRAAARHPAGLTLRYPLQ